MVKSFPRLSIIPKNPWKKTGSKKQINYLVIPRDTLHPYYLVIPRDTLQPYYHVIPRDTLHPYYHVIPRDTLHPYYHVIPAWVFYTHII